MKHLISIDDISPTAYQHIMKRATAIKVAGDLSGKTHFWSLRDRILATIFYEPSTRTRLGFESAMFRMGGNVISTENAEQFSSAIKGESIADTFQVISGYADIIVGRFKNEGEALMAAANSVVPVVSDMLAEP
jgi:aspartate carbamoyltransferase catalytic subunit